MLSLQKTWKSWGGFVHKYKHDSVATKCPMTFCIYLPPQSDQHKVPALYFLSGLACNEDNFITKANAIKPAADHGLALVCPDTSPRGLNIPGDCDCWDFGVGAGFYVNATQEKWAHNYRMYDYVVKELPAVIKQNFPVNDLQSIFGHSMGGHGALVSFLKNPGQYQSVSAFSPICHPSQCPWGVKAFTGYLGANKEAWKDYDATHLVGSYNGPKPPVLIDQGSADEFLEKKQLLPEDFVEAAKKTNMPVEYRLQPGYDHSYFFISTFIDDHIRHHAKYLHTQGRDDSKCSESQPAC